MQPVDLDDRELIERAKSARNGAEFSALWEGAWESRFPSRSEADLALCTRLAFWTGRDAERIDRLFRSSGLMRFKWERGDYRERTLSAAIAGCADVYVPKQPGTVGDIRAKALGFAPFELFDSQQGRRSDRHAGKKQARAMIARELREQGATLDQIGQVLGGLGRSTVHELLAAGETHPARVRTQKISAKRRDDLEQQLSLSKKRKEKGNG